jgi:DNA-binding winged helix-turn-helix (wHTH) protein
MGYRLLTRLVRHAGKVVTHRQLLKEVWGPDSVQGTHCLRVFMAQLRQKIEPDSARPRYLLTEPGVGYRLAAESRSLIEMSGQIDRQMRLLGLEPKTYGLKVRCSTN